MLAHDRALRRERVFRDPLNPLEVSDAHLLRYYRFPRADIMWLCDELQEDIGRVTRRSHAIPTHTQVLVALRFYASGSFQSVLGDSVGLSQSSVSRIVEKVSHSLFTKARREIRMPRGAEELAQTKQKFYEEATFPNVIGAIDCTHIPIKAPYVDEYAYVNRKNYHSLNIQVVANSDQLITNYSAKYPGSTHDAFIWNNSDLRRRFDRGDFGHSYLLGMCILYLDLITLNIFGIIPVCAHTLPSPPPTSLGTGGTAGFWVGIMKCVGNPYFISINECLRLGQLVLG